MTVVKINAITVPEDSGDELGRRFAARAGAVDNQEGFEGFELLKPTDGRTTWLVVPRWRDEESFQAWVNSPPFGHGHAGTDKPHPHTGWPGLRRPSLWWFTAAAQLAIAVEVVLGVVLVAREDRDAPQFHMFYGFVALASVGIIYSYRQQLADRRYLLYGLGGLFLMGLGIRAMVIGLDR